MNQRVLKYDATFQILKHFILRWNADKCLS